jgi:hypothetical protein
MHLIGSSEVGSTKLKRLVVVGAFLISLTSANPQMTGFFERLRSGKPLDVQTTINQGADVNVRDNFYG